MRYCRMTLILFFICSVFCACSYRKLMINDVVEMAGTALDRFENQYDDLGMIERAAPSSIFNIEALLANDPLNSQILVLLSRAYFELTFGIEETRLEDLRTCKDPSEDKIIAMNELQIRVAAHFKKGAEYGLMALEVKHPGCKKYLTRVGKADVFIGSLEKSDMPALFWYAMNLSGYINVNKGSVKALAKLHLVKKAMVRVLEVNPSYYYGGAHLDLMTIYGSIPPMLGGNPGKALEHYRALKAISGNDFLLADLLYARYYLYTMDKTEEYVNTLKGIINHKIKGRKYRLLNIIAKKRAKIYLRSVMEKVK